jgi:putative Na+/H+ antiporter
MPSAIEMIATTLFVFAIVHTFATKLFERLAHTRPTHAGLWHLLGEVEVVFGFWAMLFVLALTVVEGREAATSYLDTRDFTEPMFVFAVMVVAGSRPILRLASAMVRTVAAMVPIREAPTTYFLGLSLLPLLGSFITEPAAMTLAALMLGDRFYAHGLPDRVRYGTLGVLFVNVSIGGTLTPYAAPPVLMVAGTWNWDLMFMMTTFGWKAALAVLINALAATLLLGGQLPERGENTVTIDRVPKLVTGVHLFFLAGVVFFAHHPAVFVGLLLFFLGFASAYEKYQDRLIVREGLLVAFFLAGLVVLGGPQRWWLQPLLTGRDVNTVFWGATSLTAITDNAALTYLASQVQGLSSDFKYALVAGAVTGGGLTVIANAPNPAGFSMLRSHFDDGAISPLGLLAAAIPPTLVAAAAFLLL